MKIGMVCPYSWDVPGGVQQHIRDLAEALIEEGHDVSVISPADDDTPLPPYVVAAGRAVPVPYNGSVARLSFGFLSVSRVRRWLNQGAFDVLHVHEPAVPSLSLLACWVASGPIVATFHTAIPALAGARRHLPGAAHRAGEDQRPDRGLRGGPDHAGRAPRRRRGRHPERRGHPPLPQGRPAARLARPRPGHRLPRPAGRVAQGPARAAQGVRDPRPGPARAAPAGGRPGATPRTCSSGSPPGCATGWCCSGRSARTTRSASCTRSTCSARRTPAVSRSASSPPRRWRPGCPSWPATSRRSARSWTAGRRGSCSPSETRPTWPGPPGACS